MDFDLSLRDDVSGGVLQIGEQLNSDEKPKGANTARDNNLHLGSFAASDKDDMRSL